MRSGDYHRAIEQFELAKKNNPYHPVLLMKHIQSLQSISNFEQAKPNCNFLFGYHKQYYEGLKLVSWNHFNTGEADSALFVIEHSGENNDSYKADLA